MSENTYSSYLHLDQLLSAQDCATEADSELLFLTIHQAKELWFKLMIHELEGARRALYAGDEMRAYKSRPLYTSDASAAPPCVVPGSRPVGT